MNNIFNFCKNFRIHNLELTLLEMENITNIKHKTISAFENGRSNNINHLNMYYTLCSTDKLRIDFIQGISEALENNRLNNNNL